MDTHKFFRQNAGICKSHLPAQLLPRLYLIDLIKKQSCVFHMDERKSLTFTLKIQDREGWLPVVVLTIKYIYPEKNTEHRFLNTRINEYSFHKKNLISGRFVDEKGDEQTFNNPSGYLFEENALLAKQTESHVKMICKELDKVIDLTPKAHPAKQADSACECVIF